MPRLKPLVGATIRCPECNGTGVPAGALNDPALSGRSGGKKPEACRRCLGRGRVHDPSPARDDRTCAHFLKVSDCALCRPPR